MAVIEHWIAHPPMFDGVYVGPAIIRNRHSADEYRRLGCDVDGPYVPADQLRGAVEALRELDEMLRPMPPFNPVRVKVREAVERFGGQ